MNIVTDRLSQAGCYNSLELLAAGDRRVIEYLVSRAGVTVVLSKMKCEETLSFTVGKTCIYSELVI